MKKYPVQEMPKPDSDVAVEFKSGKKSNDKNAINENEEHSQPLNPQQSNSNSQNYVLTQKIDSSNYPNAPPIPKNYYNHNPPVPQPMSGMMPQLGANACGNPMNQQIWMQRPPEMPGCPVGLEYLTMVDSILVHQQIELLEVFTNWETKNKYQIKNAVGQQVYYAAEESDVCARQCCGPQRGFVMHITDNMGTEVIRAIRDFKCCAGPCCQCCAGIPMCAQELFIEAPPGQVIGRIIQKSSCMEPCYAIQSADFETMLYIRGPVCICQGPCCTWDQEFKVYSSDMSTEVGRISKQWSGFVHEYFTDADNFGVSFPLDLDVKMKATMLGAVFLIDFMFFENNQQNQNT